MLDTNYVTLEIGKTKHIALVAHDGKKKELVDWCDKNKEISLNKIDMFQKELNSIIKLD